MIDTVVHKETITNDQGPKFPKQVPTRKKIYSQWTLKEKIYVGNSLVKKCVNNATLFLLLIKTLIYCCSKNNILSAL